MLRAEHAILDLMPADARLMLHVGCGAGTLGTAYKRRNPAARILGTEPDAEAAARARLVLDEVWQADITADPMPFAEALAPATADCIVFDGALDGAREPWKIVSAYVQFLAEHGTLLLCLPNPDHWQVTQERIRGLRAGPDPRFADAVVEQALARMGLVALDRTPLAADPRDGDAFIAAIAPALRGLKIDVAAHRARALSARCIWRARRRPVARLVSVVSSMLTPVGGVSEVRVTEPMRALASEPSLKLTVIANSIDPPVDIKGHKIFVYHRPLLAGEDGLARIRRLIRAGWLVVCEFDDHPDYIKVLQRPDVQNFRAVHAIQTSTPALAAVLARDNPEIGLFANAIPALPDVVNFASDASVTLFFAGLNRDNEWPPYIDAINAVAARMGDRLRFEVVNDRAFFEALRTGHKSFTPLCDYQVYQDILARSEISFMPLLDTPFNRCKSDLKFIEAASRRVLSLASDVVYADSIEDGRTGILFRDPQELEQRLTRLVSEPMLARVIGDAARQYVAEARMLSYQVAERTAWYHSLCERREDLHRALLARVPELQAE
jgi:SAM-dependent methyltransferase